MMPPSMGVALVRAIILRPDLADDATQHAAVSDIRDERLREVFEAALATAAQPEPGFIAVHHELVRRGWYRNDRDARELSELLEPASDCPASEAVIYASAVHEEADRRRLLGSLTAAIISIEAGQRRDAVLSRLRGQLVGPLS